jgi:hypothetical protein
MTGRTLGTTSAAYFYKVYSGKEIRTRTITFQLPAANTILSFSKWCPKNPYR